MSLENPWGQVPEPEAEPIEMPSPERVAEQLCARLKEALFPLLAGHATFVLIEPIEMEMFGPEGHPDGRERDQCP